jgi:hypothetical protein
MANALLDAEEIRNLAESNGPCISMLLPPFVPGSQPVSGAAAALKNLMEQAAGALQARHLPQSESGRLLEPIQKLLGTQDVLEGHRWSRIIFRSPETLESFDLHTIKPPKVSVADRFDLLAVLPELDIPIDFFVLQLSKKRTHLLRGPGFETVPLPGVPDTLENFLELDIPDHDRENRSAIQAGSSGRRIRFGTGTEREAEAAHLHDYYTAVDRALIELTTPAANLRPPLLLAGVDEDTSVFRGLSRYPNRIDATIGGSPTDGASHHDLLDRSLALIRENAVNRAAADLASARERLAPARFSSDPPKISACAAEGRIERLFLRSDIREQYERFNTAAVETIRHGGQVSVLPPDRMPEPAAALLRF